MGKQLAVCEHCGDEKQKAVMAFICGADHDYWECDSCADQREFESTALRDPAYICEVCGLYDADRVTDGVCDKPSCEKQAYDYTLVPCKVCYADVLRIDTVDGACNLCEDRIQKTSLLHRNCICHRGCDCICAHEPELTA